LPICWDRPGREPAGASAVGQALTIDPAQRLARRDLRAVDRLLRALRDDPICVPDRDADVHDIASLVDVHNDLFAP